MKVRRYSEAQVFQILKEVESGVEVVNAAREHGVSPATIHRWKSKYAGMSLSELKRLKALEEENARLKRIVAQQALDNELLREINSKNGKPSRQEVSGEVSEEARQKFSSPGMHSAGDVAICGGLCCQNAAGRNNAGQEDP